MPATPCLIQFDQFGSEPEGYITTTQLAENVPFDIKRVFWTHGIPAGAMRGQHANKQTEEVLVAIHGAIQVKAETHTGTHIFELASPRQGLFIPALCWTELTFLDGAVGLCLASTNFDEADYIRDYQAFKQILGNTP